MRGRTAVLALGLLALAGCSGDDNEAERGASGTSSSTAAPAAPTTTTTSTTTSTTRAGSAQTCRGATHTVKYPGGWHTNSDRVVPRCLFFHPEPFEVPEATEVTDLAIALKVEEVPYSVVSGPSSADRELSRVRKTVAGRPAVAIEAESTGEGLLDRGILTYRYAVDLGEHTFTGSTYGVDGLDYGANKQVLDEMMGSLTITG